MKKISILTFGLAITLRVGNNFAQMADLIVLGKADKVESLLKWGFFRAPIDPNEILEGKSWTPLQLAANYGDVEIVKLLLKHKADPNSPNHKTSSPLNLAMDIHIHFSFQKYQIVEMLLKSNADPNYEGYGRVHPPILSAAFDNMSNHKILLKLISEKKTKLNKVTSKFIDTTLYGQTLLHIVANENVSKENFKEILEALKKRFTDQEFREFLNIENSAGQTVIDLLKEKAKEFPEIYNPNLELAKEYISVLARKIVFENTKNYLPTVLSKLILEYVICER